MSDDSVTTPDEIEFITKVGAMIDCVETLASDLRKVKIALEEWDLSEVMSEGKVKDSLVKDIEFCRSQFNMNVLKETEAEVKEVFRQLEKAEVKLEEMLEENESEEQEKPKAGHSGRKS